MTPKRQHFKSAATDPCLRSATRSDKVRRDAAVWRGNVPHCECRGCVEEGDCQGRRGRGIQCWAWFQQYSFMSLSVHHLVVSQSGLSRSAALARTPTSSLEGLALLMVWSVLEALRENYKVSSDDLRQQQCQQYFGPVFFCKVVNK